MALFPLMQYYNFFELQSKEVIGSRPLTAQQVKDYMRIEGFEDVDNSDSTPFTEDDTLIEGFIDTAVRVLEEKCSISIRTYTITAIITNLCGNIQIPYGPIDSDTFELTDEDGTVLDFTLIGTSYPRLKEPCYENMTATFDAGYSSVPADILTEIYRMVAYMYTHRGNEDNLKGFTYNTGSFNRSQWLH